MQIEDIAQVFLAILQQHLDNDFIKHWLVIINRATLDHVTKLIKLAAEFMNVK